MATSGRTRSTRKLRNWMVEQVSSGRYPGLVWDDDAKTMFRIPWKHAGKQDFRSDEDAAIFKAWAEFKGKLCKETTPDPAYWKTRLRCALNKSPEFSEVNERSQLDISEPYKVYRLVPMAEQAAAAAGTKVGGERVGRRKRTRESDSDSEEELAVQKIKEEAASPQAIDMVPQEVEVEREIAYMFEDGTEALLEKNDGSEMQVNEIQLNFQLIETLPPTGALPTHLVSVRYLGHEVLRQEIFQRDFRLAYFPTPVGPQPPAILGAVVPVSLPKPGPSLRGRSVTSGQLQACVDLLSYMEKGVLLTSNSRGVIACRRCRGRVFWMGPHAGDPGPRKLDRGPLPVCLFDKQTFQQELDLFRSSGGTPPQCGVTLCFGEELDTEDTSGKLITVRISLPWAKQLVQEAQAFRDSVAYLQSLASQSPLNEVTLNLIGIP